MKAASELVQLQAGVDSPRLARLLAPNTGRRRRRSRGLGAGRPGMDRRRRREYGRRRDGARPPPWRWWIQLAAVGDDPVETALCRHGGPPRVDTVRLHAETAVDTCSCIRSENIPPPFFLSSNSLFFHYFASQLHRVTADYDGKSSGFCLAYGYWN